LSIDGRGYFCQKKINLCRKEYGFRFFLDLGIKEVFSSVSIAESVVLPNNRESSSSEMPSDVIVACQPFCLSGNKREVNVPHSGVVS